MAHAGGRGRDRDADGDRERTRGPVRRGLVAPRPLLAVLTVPALLLAAACGSRAEDAAGGHAAQAVDGHHRLIVVTTTTQLTDFVHVVGGGDVEVRPVLKANVDPHDYEPTPADVDAMARADVIVKNGVGLEQWFDDTIESADPKGAIVDASQGVAIRKGSGAGETTGDPHIWHDPRNAEVMVANIARALERADPSEKATFERNRAAYTADLQRLDAHIAAEIATLGHKELVTNHDAFGYYVARYGLKFVGSVIPSFDSQAELSPRDITRLVGKIDREGVKAIFSESSLPPKTARAIGHEAGVKVVSGPDALYGDSLGPPGSAGDTYLKMEEHNTTEIVENLG